MRASMSARERSPASSPAATPRATEAPPTAISVAAGCIIVVVSPRATPMCSGREACRRRTSAQTRSTVRSSTTSLRQHAASLASALPADIKPLGTEQFVISPTAYWAPRPRPLSAHPRQGGCEQRRNWHRMDVYGSRHNAHGSWLLAARRLWEWMCAKEHIVSTAYGDALCRRTVDGHKRQLAQVRPPGDRTNTSLFTEHNVILGGFTLSAGGAGKPQYRTRQQVPILSRSGFKLSPERLLEVLRIVEQGVAVPTFTDLYTNNSVQTGDLSLRPEKNSTFKIGSRYRRTGF